MRFPLPNFAGLLLAAALALSVEASLAGPIINGRELAETTAAPDSPQAEEYRAGIQELLNGNLANANARFSASLAIEPAYAPALIGLAAVAQAQSDLPQAERHLQEAERVAPQAAEVHLAWGRLHLSNNNPVRAEEAFSKANQLAPRQIPPLLELGDLYLTQPGRSADGMRVYQEAVAIDAQNVYAQYGLGVAAAASGSRMVAFNALARAAELLPEDPSPHRLIGLLHLEAAEVDDALVAFDAGLARQPEFVALMLDRSDALARLARWEEAIAQLAAAETRAPAAPEIKTKLGDVHQGAADWAEAEKYYMQAIELAPQNPLAYNNLAWMTVERSGDAVKAVEWAKKAVALSPLSSPFHDTLGWAEQFAGNLQGAADAYQRAINLEANVAAYHYHLGVVQAALQQAASAQVSLRRALQLDPNLPEADKAAELLEKLTSG